jgi:hypothetical protein
MKRALIAIASVGILAATAWVGANAQSRIDPNIYPPYRGAPVAQQPWEWHAGPGPERRGTMCLKHTDINRGYGYQTPCPPPKKAAKK